MPEVRADTDGLYSGFEQHLRTRHPVFAKELEPWIDVCLTNNVLSQLGGEEKHKRILHAYYIGLANMYKIFEVAIEFLREKYNKEKKPIWTKFAELKKNEANAIQFLTDLCNFVEFTSTDEQKEYRAKAKALANKLNGLKSESEEYKQLEAEVARNPVGAFTEEDSKLQKLIKKGLPYLLMYPNRLTNIFINVLADVFVMLKGDAKLGLLEEFAPLFKDPTTKAITKNNPRAFAAEFYARIYEQRVGGKIDGDDLNGCNGFFLDEEPAEFNELITHAFWDQLFHYSTTLHGAPTIPSVDFFTVEWAQVAAYVFRWYMDYNGSAENYIESLFAFFKAHSMKGEPSTIYNNESRWVTMPPDAPKINGVTVEKKTFTTPVYGTTLQELLSIMDNTTLEFILNLARTMLTKGEPPAVPPTTQGTAESTTKTFLPRTPESPPVRPSPAGALPASNKPPATPSQ